MEAMASGSGAWALLLGEWQRWQCCMNTRVGSCAFSDETEKQAKSNSRDTWRALPSVNGTTPHRPSTAFRAAAHDKQKQRKRAQYTPVGCAGYFSRV